MSWRGRSRLQLWAAPPDRPAADSEPATRKEPGPFTRFLREWEPGREPETAVASAMWSELGRVVRQELRRRSLTESSPQWLGIYGFAGWWDATGRGGPFEDLLAEVYRYVFLDRFAALKALAQGGDIEALVRTSVRHCLHDRQRWHDRLGTRLFEVLVLAARRAVAGGGLRVVAGSAKIGSSTVLAAGERGPAADRPPLATAEALAAIVRRWNDELLPDLVTASRADKRRLIEELTRRLTELDLAGVVAFRFGDLITPLRADVRQRWAALLPPAEEEEREEEEEARGLRRLRRSFDPTRQTFESQVIATDRFQKLIDCVDAAIQARPNSERTRGYLRRVLLFLRAFATEQESPLEEEAGGSDPDRLPSFRRLSEHLGIPRERLGQLVETLKSFLERCRRRLDGGELVRFRADSPGTEEVRS